MTAHHHIDDATLLRYASGDLDEAFSVVVASHIAMCDACRREVRRAEEIGGELFDQAEPADLSSDAFARLMEGLKGAEPATKIRISEDATKEDTPAGDVPQPLRRFIGASLDEVRWKMVAPGVRKFDLTMPSDSHSALYMLKINPGLAVPEHGHGGAEITLILSGAYRDSLGRFATGDIADLDEEIEHQPRVEGDEPCICLVATEAPTRFRGVISRLLQPLIGI